MLNEDVTEIIAVKLQYFRTAWLAFSSIKRFGFAQEGRGCRAVLGADVVEEGKVFLNDFICFVRFGG
jgi:hypothetical protein